MTAIGPLPPERVGEALALFHASLHRPPPRDEVARAMARAEPARTWAAVEGGELIGTTWSFGAHTAVPGGAMVPTAAVSRIGVRADRTRRGVLTALLRAQLAELRERGEVLATLHASEGGIYGRFGFGVATRSRAITVDTTRAAPHRDAPPSGPVRLLDLDGAFAELPELYRRLDLRTPGVMSRPAHWWPPVRAMLADTQLVTAVHGDRGAEDGFASYEVTRGKRGSAKLLDLFAATPGAFAGLWRFLLGLDLVAEVVSPGGPLDEQVEALFTDPWACAVTGVHDEMWLRLLDVPAALAARAYGHAEPVVLGVRDALLPANSGSYLVGPYGVQRSTAPPQLELDAAWLAAMYLGDTAPSRLATAGRVVVRDPSALLRADALFGTAVRPWCGTMF